MLFSKKEIEVLKVIGAYMDVPAKISDAEIGKILSEFLEYGYLKYNRKRTSLRLTQAGTEILISAGFPAKTQSRSIGEGNLLERRLQSSRTAMFLCGLGIDVFSNEIPDADKISRTVYLSTAELRRQKYANVLGMSKFIGLLYTSDFTYAVYNVSDASETFYPQNDEEIFSREIISANIPAKILYVSSQSYKGIAESVIAAKSAANKSGKNAVNFYEAIERFTAPVCIVPTDGANQLRITLTEDYREKLARYMLNVSYRFVNTDIIDAQFKKDKFFLVFIDFDVKRLEKALKLVKDLHILALEEQVDALTVLLGGRKAEVYGIKADEAFYVLGIPPPENKQLKQFKNEKGDGIIAIKNKKQA